MNLFNKSFFVFILLTTSCFFGQTVYNYNYTGSVQTVTLQPGDYQFEVWGAQGGGTGGGKGGYSKGVINITQPTIYYIFVGEQGVTSSSRGSGGGGTDIRTSSNGIWYDNLNSRIIVAGGGGGGSSIGFGGYGGGTAGGNGRFNNSSQGGQFGYGASSSSGGGVDPGDEGLANCLGGMNGSFGYGGDARYVGRGNSCTDSNFYPSMTSWQYRDLYGSYNGGGTYDLRGGESSGGGGGYYGGGAPGSGDFGGGGGGGSGYVSSLVFTVIQLTAGNASMPNPSGGTMTGKSGSGYARITQLSSGGTISSTTSLFCTPSVDPVAFTSSAAANGGSGTFSYQWQESNDGTNFTDISGATGLTYDPGVISQTKHYRRKAVNSLTLYSNVVSIEKFQFTTHPNTSTQNLLLNATPTNLNIAVSNTSGVSYQWYKNNLNSNSGGSSISSSGTSTTYTPPTSAEGNWYYYAVATREGCSVSSNVSGLVSVNKPTPTVSFSDVTKTYGDASFTLSTTSNNTSPFVYSVTDTNVATVSGNTLSIVGAGSTTVTVTQVADANYQASSTTMTLTVNKATPILSNFNTISKITDDAPFTLIAPTSSGGTGLITYSSSNIAVATLVGNTVTITGSGSTIITATQAADVNYNTQTISSQLVVGVGTTQAPELTSPLSNTIGATILQFNYSLPESPLPGSVKLIFTPISGGTLIIWNMNNAITANFAYPVGTNPTLINSVISGAALGFTRYNVTLSYQDVFASPEASTTNTNIETLVPLNISLAKTNFNALVNKDIIPIVPTISSGKIVSFSISPELPNGLIINSTTGIITGRPLTELPITNFTITAISPVGSTTVIFSLFIDWDTDDDGIGDSIDTDIDGDGVINSQELIDGTDPNNACDSVPSSITVPLSQLFLDGDCDGDGLSNGEELGLNLMLPTDVDNNGTADYLEFNNHSQSEDNLEIFNSMTVNGDGLNDVFVIRGIENYPDNNLYIYNRWGVEVYNVEGYGQDDKYFRGLSEGRNTISQSAELPKGTYYFILRYKNKQGVDKQRSGYLYITK